MLKTKYQTDKTDLENNIPDTSSLVKKTNYDAKIADIEGKIPDVTNLATKTVLPTVEKKCLVLVVLLKKQIIALKLQTLKINLILIIMTNILILQSL